MVTNLLIIISLLLLMTIYHSLLISKYNLIDEQDSEKHLFSLITNILALITLYSVFGYYSYLFLFSFINKVGLTLLITVIINALAIVLLTVLPLLTVNDRFSEGVIRVLKPFDLLSKIIFYIFAEIYLTLRKVTFKPIKEVMTEDEFLDIIDLAEEQLGINENESKLIKNVLDFDQMKVLDILTPRTEIIACEKKQTVEEVKNIFKTSGYSRLPIYEDSLDNIIGTINFKDLYNSEASTRKELRKVLVKPLEVTEYMNLNDLLTLLKANKQHLAIVKDEFGGTVGIVSLEDLLEELVGDIYDEHDKEIKQFEKINNHKYEVKGSTYLDDLEGIFDFEELDDEDYLTVNGFVVNHLGKIAEVGDTFLYKNLKVTVLKADLKQTKLVEIEVLDNKEQI